MNMQQRQTVGIKLDVLKAQGEKSLSTHKKKIIKLNIESTLNVEGRKKQGGDGSLKTKFA